MRQVEVAACEELAAGSEATAAATAPGSEATAATPVNPDGPSPAELEAIRGATFTVEAIAERERVTDHDAAAFVDVLGRLGGAGRSLDPPRADLERRARHRPGAAAAPRRRRSCCRTRAGSSSALADTAREHVHTLCVGRTHGIHAEPTTFGIKLAGFAFEAHRNAARLERAFAQAAVGAISGAVGTYSATSPDFEQRVLAPARARARAGLDAGRGARPPRRAAAGDRARRRRARALRHRDPPPRADRGRRGCRSRSAAGQKGSSAMPHKRNPIKSEQIAGLARVLRGNAQAALENVALWHERDISHSSVERVILPDSTTLLDHMQRRADRTRRGDGRRLPADAGQPRPDLRRPVLPARAAGAGRAGLDAATMPTASSSAWPSARSTNASSCASCSPTDRDGQRARPRRDLRLRAVRTLRRRDRGAARRDRLTLTPEPPDPDPGPGPDPSASLASIARVTALADLPLIASGKVREIYDRCPRAAAARRHATGSRPTTQSTRRRSPARARCSPGLSVFWFERTREIVPNHLISVHRGRSARRRAGARCSSVRLEMLPVECVVRGYLTGSGWKDYQRTGAGLRDRAAAGAARIRSAARAAVHPRDQGGRRATTRTSTSRARSS